MLCIGPDLDMHLFCNWNEFTNFIELSVVAMYVPYVSVISVFQVCEHCLVLLRASHPSKPKSALHSCVAAILIFINGFGKIGNPNYIMSFASQWNVPLYLDCKEGSPVTKPYNLESVCVCACTCVVGVPLSHLCWPFAVSYNTIMTP